MTALLNYRKLPCLILDGDIHNTLDAGSVVQVAYQSTLPCVHTRCTPPRGSHVPPLL